jgi:hypothetical protein
MRLCMVRPSWLKTKPEDIARTKARRPYIINIAYSIRPLSDKSADLAFSCIDLPGVFYRILNDVVSCNSGLLLLFIISVQKFCTSPLQPRSEPPFKLRRSHTLNFEVHHQPHQHFDHKQPAQILPRTTAALSPKAHPEGIHTTNFSLPLFRTILKPSVRQELVRMRKELWIVMSSP